MNHFGWGLQMAAVGMGLVFGLLALLWGLLALIGRLDKPAEAAVAAPVLAAPPPVEPPGPAPELLAAITAAVVAHRAHLRQQAAPSVRSFRPGSLIHTSRWVGAGRARQNQSWQRRTR